MSIQHIFFDLDRTLWDFEKNSHETLSELYSEHQLERLMDTSTDHFIERYKKINESCWEDYRLGKIDKETLRTIRFRRTFEHFGVQHESLADRLGNAYIERCPLKTNLFPGTFELLDDLSKTHELHIITNGFEEVQHVKMKASGISGYFKVIMTSEKAGCKKPDTDIFIKAMSDAGARAHESLMIGDHYEVDVLGAENVGMKAVLFDPDNNMHLNVNRISELEALKNWI